MVKLGDIELPLVSPVVSPFTNVISLDYWDGSLVGLAWCNAGSPGITFQVVSWDSEQDVRIFSLAEAQEITANEAYDILSPIGTPRLPEWVPSPQPEQSEHRRAIERLATFLPPKGPPSVVLASPDLTKIVLAARSVERDAAVHLPAKDSFPTSQNWEFWRRYLDLPSATIA
ncbi:MAG TPA: hypothetical protein VFQ00_01890 [Terriglobales bacterium]|nr:hypothetical protein [Terriglobales bacterium]